MKVDAGAAQKATCLSVAAVTVDENFKIVDQWKINSRFRKSRAFEVDAMLAHNIPVEVIEKEKLSNSELVDEWEKRFKALAERGTIFVGYNSMNYDNILLQNSLYINLKWPYITNKEQFDLLPAISVLVYSHLVHLIMSLMKKATLHFVYNQCCPQTV